MDGGMEGERSPPKRAIPARAWAKVVGWEVKGVTVEKRRMREGGRGGRDGVDMDGAVVVEVGSGEEAGEEPETEEALAAASCSRLRSCSSYRRLSSGSVRKIR